MGSMDFKNVDVYAKNIYFESIYFNDTEVYSEIL